DEVVPNSSIVYVGRRARQETCTGADSQSYRPCQHADETSQRCTNQRTNRPHVISLLYACCAICAFCEYGIPVHADAALSVQLEKRLLAFISFVLVVKNHH